MMTLCEFGQKAHYPSEESSVDGPEATHMPLRYKYHLIPEDAATELEGGSQSVLESLSWDPWALLIFNHPCVGGDFCVSHLYKIHHNMNLLRTLSREYLLPVVFLSCL